MLPSWPEEKYEAAPRGAVRDIRLGQPRPSRAHVHVDCEGGAEKLKSLPAFKSEKEERQFWATHDSMDYIDWSKAERASFPDLKPTARTISVRLPVTMIANLKVLANQRDVPYQSLLKMFLADRLKEEIAPQRRR